MVILKRISLLVLAEQVIALSLVALFTHASAGGVSCTNDKDCGESEGLIQGVSVCENGKCTNPFEQGCINVMSEKYGKKNIPFPSAFEKTRICSSDDDLIPKDNRRCRKPKLADFFQYDEIRVAPGNWDSAIIMGWIYQILLTEVLEVPVTIENGDGKIGVGSFYDRTNGFTFVDSEYENTIHYTLWESERVGGDCSKADKPCAHILPDVWDSGVNQKDLVDGRILPGLPNGVIGRLGFFIPEFTAKNHPELYTFYGLSGEENRHKLAEHFLTPVTWQFYCYNITKSSNCTDSVSIGPPLNAADGAKYHKEGSYTGHFYTPPDGNCTINPKTCTGHFVNANCNWSTYSDAQMHWNNISLTSRGSLQANNGYAYGSMLQIWAAAAATKNNVLMWWWYPDSLLEQYENTEAKLLRLNWESRPTEKCLKWRINNIDRCAIDDGERRGAESTGACDMPVEKILKYLSKSLKDVNDNAPEVSRSPTFPLMSQLKIPPYAMGDILRNWLMVKKDLYGYDSREATCKWVYDNMEMLVEEHFPRGYPREINERRSVGLVIVAYILASIALVAILLVAVLIAKFKDKREMRYVQVEFLFWMIAGLFIITIGAITGVHPSSSGTCITSEWSILIGYTLELAPILVKVEAMNAISCEDIIFRRIEIDSKKLKKHLIFFIAPVLVYLIVWTVLDAPEPIESLTLDYKSKNKNIVDLDRSCSSSSVVWSILSYIVQFLLLLCSSVLTFNSRGANKEIEESQFIGFLVYSHFMFLIFRIVTRALSAYGAIDGTVSSSVVSILLSFDVLAGAVIYFGPKLYNVMNENSNSVMRSGLAAAGRSSSISELRKTGISVIKKKPTSNVSDAKSTNMKSSMKSSMKSNLSGMSGVSSALDSNTNHSNQPPRITRKLVSFMDED